MRFGRHLLMRFAHGGRGLFLARILLPRCEFPCLAKFVNFSIITRMCRVFVGCPCFATGFFSDYGSRAGM